MRGWEIRGSKSLLMGWAHILFNLWWAGKDWRKKKIKSNYIIYFVYTIVFCVGTNTLLQINYTEREFQKSRAYLAGLPSK